MLRFHLGLQGQNSGVDNASASGTVDSGLIPSWVKSMTFKIDVHSFLVVPLEKAVSWITPT